MTGVTYTDTEYSTSIWRMEQQFVLEIFVCQEHYQGESKKPFLRQENKYFYSIHLPAGDGGTLFIYKKSILGVILSWGYTSYEYIVKISFKSIHFVIGMGVFN